MPLRRHLALIALAARLAAAQSTPLPPPTHTEVAPGVHLFQTQPYGDVGLDGNSIAIVGDDGVLVFDANGTPAAATNVLAQIRAITSKPIKYLVLSHWHWDHWYGAEVYKKAFPALEVIGHEKTKMLMAGPAIVFNKPGIDEQLPAHITSVKDSAHAAYDRWFLAQKRDFTPTLPTRTITDTLTLQLGGRTVQVRHDDRAITPGDVYLWLPNERIVVSGDLIINPITFGLFCYPSGWIRTLDTIDALNPATIIPGHGAPMQDRETLRATRALVAREIAIAKEQRAASKPLDSAIPAAMADSELLALREKITKGVAARNGAFKLYLVDWVMKRIYQELDGPLDDTIPKSP